MVNKKGKTPQQQGVNLKNENKSATGLGSLGALLTAALQEKKPQQQKLAKRNDQESLAAEKAVISREENETYLQEFEKRAAQSRETISTVKLQQPSSPRHEPKPVRKVAFAPKETPVNIGENIDDKNTTKVQVTTPSKKDKKRLNLALESVKGKPVALSLGYKEPVKSKIVSTLGQKDVLFGCQTQIYTTSHAHESEIIIGIDLGTSSTKVVVRDMGLNQAYAVPFTDFAPRENCYLLPTAISINQDGSMSLGTGFLPKSGLKLRFIENPLAPAIEEKDGDISLNNQELLVGYLALAFREIRGWFFEHTQNQYANTELKWNINIGIPSENYDNEQLRFLFRLVTQIAWYASNQMRPVDIELIKNSSKEIEETNRRIAQGDFDVLDEAHLHPGYFSTHPEVIMEVVGYVKARLGEEGTHLLIDIGASTLDVATFRVGQREGEDTYPMLSSKVAPLGSFMLHKRRIASLKTTLESALNKISEIDPIEPLPQISTYQIDTSGDGIGKTDTEFYDNCYKAIGEVVRNTKLTRDVISEVWKGQLPVFICGGGGKEKMYSNVIARMSLNYAKTSQEFKGFKVLDIPKPSTLQAPNIAPDEYRRLAVAYGLSFSTFEIGKIIPESSVEDHRKDTRPVDFSDRFVGPEQV